MQLRKRFSAALLTML